MTQYQEAKKAFETCPSEDSANAYHRAAWRAYLADEIDTETLEQAIREVDAWSRKPKKQSGTKQCS
jgi:hypothetical protein